MVGTIAWPAEESADGAKGAVTAVMSNDCDKDMAGEKPERSVCAFRLFEFDVEPPG